MLKKKKRITVVNGDWECPRLSAQLLSTTWQQTQLQMESDLEKMNEWARRFETMVAKQDYGYFGVTMGDVM